MSDKTGRLIGLIIGLVYCAPLLIVLMMIAVLWSIVNLIRRYTTVQEEIEMWDELIYFGYKLFRNFVENGELSDKEEEEL
jgi:uncharacterized membrane protein